MTNQWHIGEILIQKRLIDWKQLEEALAEQRRTREFVGEVLIRKQYVPKFLFFKALAERHAIPFVDLTHIFIDARAVERVPKSVAVRYHLMPIEIQDHTLVVGISNPVKELPDQEIAELAKVQKIKKVLCTPDAVAQAIEVNYGAQAVGSETGA